MKEKGQPSTHGANGRTAKGRFAPGNNYGRGNPLAGRAAKIRAAMFEAVDSEDIKEVIGQLVQKAKNADLAAIKILLDRTIGPPVEIDLLERLESLEKIIEEQKAWKS